METNKHAHPISSEFIERFSKAINIAKGVAILLVVLGHINSPFGGIIYSFHIPLFFVLGGVFINVDNHTWQYLKKNLLRIVVPFFLFGLLGWAVNSGKVMLLHRPHEYLLGDLAGLFWWMDIDHLQHYGFVLWFLPALFWARVIAFFVEKYLNINRAVTLFLFLWLSYFSSSQIIMPLAFDKGLLALPWVFVGYLFNKYKQILLIDIVWKAVIVIAMATALAYFGGIIPLDMARKNIADLYLSFPYTVCVSYLVICLAYHVKHITKISRWLVLVGQSSMLVLVFHPYINNFSHLLVSRYVHEGWYFKFFISLLILWSLIAIKNRHHKNITFRFL